MTRVGLVGAGRAGVGFGYALSLAGYDVTIHSREPKRLPVSLSHTSGASIPWLGSVQVVLVAVPDDAIATVAGALARTGLVGSSHCVLHLSGVCDRTALDALGGSGAALGSLHPFQTLVDPREAPARLRGAVAALEGDVRARSVATQLAEAVGMRPITIAPEHKVRYHAAAVFSSNYAVTLAAVAERLLDAAGVEEATARQAVVTLMRGAVGNLEAGGPAAALTGPVVRGDAQTIERHLHALPPDLRPLYRALARATLAFAELSPERRTAIEHLLG